MRGEDPEHNAGKQHERINQTCISSAVPSSYKCDVGDRSNNIAVVLNLLSATAANDDNDKDDSTTSASSDVDIDGGDAAQFAHIIRQEVTRVQVLSQLHLCPSGKQQWQRKLRHKLIIIINHNRNQIQEGQLGSQVQLCQTARFQVQSGCGCGGHTFVIDSISSSSNSSISDKPLEFGYCLVGGDQPATVDYWFLQ